MALFNIHIHRVVIIEPILDLMCFCVLNCFRFPQDKSLSISVALTVIICCKGP